MQIRRIHTIIEDVLSEAGRTADPPLRKVAVAAVVKNPYAGVWQDDLGALVEASADLGALISARAVAALGGVPAESYGKGAIIGLAGEQEHGVALLTTVYGDVIRQAIGGGVAWISSATKRGGPNTIIDIPLAHKDALYVRSHYDALTVHIPDAPLPDEIAIICCYATRGRLNARVGGIAADAISGLDGLR